MGRISAFIGAAAIGMAMLAFAPAAMAISDPPPDICLFDLSEPVTLDQAIQASAVFCDLADVADVRLDPVSLGGDQGEAASALCAITHPSALDFASYRQHVDPGRCLV